MEKYAADVYGMQYTLQATSGCPLFPAKVSFTWQSACCSAFLLTLLSALHLTTMSADDMITHLLNDRGVDSAALAEVMTD